MIADQPARHVRLRLDPEREEHELRQYLGPKFDRARLERHVEEVEREFGAAADEGSFYRSSEAYLYDLTAFAMSQTKLPYLADLVRSVPPPATVLDYGCGIGSDGLLLAESGYTVRFADFDNPSTRYLRWRLRRRGIDAELYDIDRGVPGGHDAVYSFDVIEHVADPWRHLDALEARGRVVAVNLLEADARESALHRELPIPALLRRARRGAVLRYRVYHERSHLLIYAPRSRAIPARLRGELEFAAGRLLRSRLPRPRRPAVDRRRR